MSGLSSSHHVMSVNQPVKYKLLKHHDVTSTWCLSGTCTGKKKKIKIKRLKSVQILASARNNTSVFTDELLRLQRLISEVSSSTGMKMWIV